MSSEQRDYGFDNLKGFLIILVVFAHFLERIVEGGISANPVILCIYSFIYSFHMPVFIFVSGYYSKSVQDGDAWAKKTVQSVLIPFLTANFFYWILSSRNLPTFFYPQFAMWYLLSLFFWRVLILPLSKIKGIFIVSLIMSLYIGITGADRFFSLSRTIAFFPYFIAGFIMSKETVKKIREKGKAIAAILAATSLAAAIILALFGKVVTQVYTMAYPYEFLEYSNVRGMLLRTIALLLGFIGIFWTVSLFSTKRTALASLGVNTMTIYIAHPFFARLYVFLKLPKFSQVIYIIPVAAVLTAAVCAVLGNKRATRLYNQVMGRLSAIILK